MISDFPRVMSEIRRLFLAIGILLLATGDGGAERINQEGRILGPAPVGHNADFVQYPGSRRDCFRDANHARDESVERRYFAAAASGQFRCHDRADQMRSFADASELARRFTK